MLKINNKMRYELAINGLKIAQSLKDIEAVSNKYEKTADNIDITSSKGADVVRFWLLNGDGYLTQDQSETITAHYEEEAQNIADIIKYSALYQSDAKKAQMVANGYKITLLKDNRPLTLLNAKNKDFVFFVGIGRLLNIFDITEDKKTVANRLIGSFGCYWGHDARKESNHIYLVTHPQAEEMRQARQQANARHEARMNNKPSPYFARYVNYVSCDKSGYTISVYSSKLKERLIQLKNKRYLEMQEALKEEWKNQDKSELLDQLLKVSKKLEELFITCNCFTLTGATENNKKLEKIIALNKDLKDLFKVDKFASLERWQNDFNELTDELDYWTYAFGVDDFSKVSCRHHYEKAEQGYKMKAKYQDGYWDKYYYTEF